MSQTPLAVAVLLLTPSAIAQDPGFVVGHLAQARDHFEHNEPVPARAAVDRAGLICDPGLKAGRGWKAEDGPTFVDAALEKLLRS